MQGTLVLVIGPSGSGKGTLISHVRPLFPAIEYPKSCTTRERRGEGSDERYEFLSPEEFRRKVDAGEFLEWAEYGGNLYGTLRSSVVPLVESGRVVLKELEVQGVRQVREKLSRDQFVIVFVNAGSWDEMEKRIRARAPMPDYELSKRKERYEDEMGFMAEADYVVDNPMGKVEAAKKSFEEIIRGLVS